MSKVIDFFRLIRFTNIVFIALTQLLFQYCIIATGLHESGLTTTLNIADFLLLTFSTTLVAAAGYIINDYFDEKIDAINKPNKVFIEKSIRRRVAMIMHFTFNGIATLIGIYLAVKTHNYKMAFVNPAIAVLLWFYSTTFKRQFLTGNILVALLCALTIIVPVFYEKQLFNFSDDDFFAITAAIISLLTLSYATFAFLTTMIREVVKDIEDMQGDAKYGCRTLPVAFGIRPAKKFTLVLAILTFAILIIALFIANHMIPILYIASLIITPMAYFIYKLYRADLQKDFHQLSALIKFIIFTGILSMALFSFTSFWS